MQQSKPLKIAVIGSGITGLSCAWLLSHQHQVTVFEKDSQLGGHSNTVDVACPTGNIPVDTGFIVCNPVNYPNLMALFKHLNVETQATNMSFSVSMDQGAMEYCGGDGLLGLLAQPSNLFKPAYWSMLKDILRFYRQSERGDFANIGDICLADLLSQLGYKQPFIQQHLLPMGAAIWSTPMDKMLQYPAQSFLDFCANHGLLQLKDRPQWHTVVGGSREYVDRLSRQINGSVHRNRGVKSVRRMGGKVLLQDWQGDDWTFDHIVFACHADQALKILDDPRHEESDVLSSFKFQRNRAVLHSDQRLMPKRKNAWASWNYMGSSEQQEVSVSYWMNRLQRLGTEEQMFVSLNPIIEPDEGNIHASFLYDHPLFNQLTHTAQRQLWSLQGQNNTWFCGAWCGHGFHEDGLQAGLIVAEALGDCKRPWSGDNLNSRIPLPHDWQKINPAKQVAA